MEKRRILLVDDDQFFHKSMEIAFSKFYQFVHAYTDEDMQSILQYKTIDLDLILLDLILDNKSDEHDGIKRMKEVKSKAPSVPIIIITNSRKVDIAVEAMKEGASYYFTKQRFDIKEWQNTIDKCIDSGHKLIPQLEGWKDRFIGNSKGFVSIKQRIETLSRMPEEHVILITGESGVGKRTATNYYLALCDLKSEKVDPLHERDTLEQNLFGRHGIQNSYFETLQDGVLVIKEITDVDKYVQARLLSFIEENKVYPIGSKDGVSVNVRLIVTTSKNLEKEKQEGRFSEDLYYSLQRCVINIPPLREREDDMLLLMKCYLGISQEENLEDKVDKEVIGLLKAYDWPGNVREFYNMCHKLKNKLEKINIDCVPKDIIDKVKKSQKNIDIKKTTTEEHIGFFDKMRELIKQNLIIDVFQELDKQFEDIRNELISLERRYNNFVKKKRAKKLTFREEQISEEEIIHALLEIIDELEKEAN